MQASLNILTGDMEPVRSLRKLPQTKPRPQLRLTSDGSSACPEVARNGRTAAADRLAVVTCWFGDDPVRLKAARQGAAQLCAMRPRPAIMLLVETGRTRSLIPEWTGERLYLEVDDQHAWIWQKERMLNIGMEWALRQRPDLTGFMLPDIDIVPTDSVSDWCGRTAAGLEEAQVLQPWSVLSETQGPYRIQSLANSIGTRNLDVGTGPGGVHAMTADFFRKSGGLYPGCIAGGGDTVNFQRWLAGRFRSIKPTSSMQMNLLCDRLGHTGPGVAWLQAHVQHIWHGSRSGKASNRHYNDRHTMWDWGGGTTAVVEDDPATGLYRWKSDPVGQSMKELRGLFLTKGFADEASQRRTWNGLLAKHNFQHPLRGASVDGPAAGWASLLANRHPHSLSAGILCPAGLNMGAAIPMWFDPAAGHWPVERVFSAICVDLREVGSDRACDITREASRFSTGLVLTAHGSDDGLPCREVHHMGGAVIKVHDAKALRS